MRLLLLFLTYIVEEWWWRYRRDINWSKCEICDDYQI